MPVIIAIWEAEIKSIVVPVQHRQIVHKTPIFKITICLSVCRLGTERNRMRQLLTDPLARKPIFFLSYFLPIWLGKAQTQCGEPQKETCKHLGRP
jgi:hypothetical protein